MYIRSNYWTTGSQSELVLVILLFTKARGKRAYEFIGAASLTARLPLAFIDRKFGVVLSGCNQSASFESKAEAKQSL